MTVPLPLPLAALVIVSQLASLVAVHAQPAVVVTATLAVPPPLTIACVVGAAVKLHAAPLCVTVTVCPATVSVPLRDAVEGLAAAV